MPNEKSDCLNLSSRCALTLLYVVVGIAAFAGLKHPVQADDTAFHGFGLPMVKAPSTQPPMKPSAQPQSKAAPPVASQELPVQLPVQRGPDTVPQQALIGAQSDRASSSWCPPVGMTMKVRTVRGEYTVTHKGADQNDPMMCLRISDGYAAGSDSGKLLHRLFGWYDYDDTKRTDETDKNMRSGLSAILSGQRSEINFEMTNSRRIGNYVWSGTEHWARTGEDVLTINNQSIKVTKLREEFKGGANTSFAGYVDIWYDPARHAFMKVEPHISRGVGGYSGEVVEISP